MLMPLRSVPTEIFTSLPKAICPHTLLLFVSVVVVVVGGGVCVCVGGIVRVHQIGGKQCGS